MTHSFEHKHNGHTLVRCPITCTQDTIQTSVCKKKFANDTERHPKCVRMDICTKAALRRFVMKH